MYDQFYLIHFLNFVSRGMRKLKLPYYFCSVFNKKYHHYVMSKLWPLFTKVYIDLNHNNLLNNSEQFNNIIWIFWWQGTLDIPPIVKSCLTSIIHHSKNYDVIFVTKNNVRKYADIPNYIYLKLCNKNITFTHFSDILRFNLLNNYGGLWIDATIYCTSNIDICIKSYTNDIYTCASYPDKYDFFTSSNRWTGFLMGGCKHNPVFMFMDAFFKYYWKYNYHLIDYFLIDYALSYCYLKNIGNFKYYTGYYAYKHCPHLGSLQSLLNHRYNRKLFKYITKDTNLFKLTYKIHFKKNSDTYYNKLK